MPKFNEFIKGFEEKETTTKPQEPKVETAPKAEAPKVEDKPLVPKKKYGGIAGYLQEAGFEPYEINEKEDYLKVKNNEGKDFEIRGSGKGYNYNVFEDGKQTYQYVPNYKPFENIVGGKNLGEFEKYRFKETPQVQPAPQKQEENVAKQENVPQQKSEFKPSEPIEEYNDSYGAMTHSEREFNVETANDYKMYSYVKKNLPTLKKLAETNPEGVIRAITSHGNYPRSFYGIEPKNIRKEYVQAVLNGFLED